MRTTASTHPRTVLRASSPRSRMLAVVALAGAAALTVGCAGQPDAPGAPTSSGAAPASGPGADPVVIEGQQLEAMGLFDEVSEQGYAVRWGDPGASIVVVVGGSGGGGDCIPQPHAAELDPSGPAIAVHFDGPDPEVMCTMDYRLHGWELGLAGPIDAEAPVPVTLTNLQGDETVIEVELGPDDLFTAGQADGSGADPQPSEVDDATGAAPPTPIEVAQLPEAAAFQQGGTGLEVWWLEPGRTLAVVLSGSGTEACVPQPIGATAAGVGAIEVAFEPAPGMTCTDDLQVYGWQLTLETAISATLPITVRVSGASDAGAVEERTLERGDVLELP